MIREHPLMVDERDFQDAVLESATEQDEQEAEQSVQEENPAPVAAAAPLPAPAAAQSSNLAELSAQLREAAAEIGNDLAEIPLAGLEAALDALDVDDPHEPWYVGVAVAPPYGDCAAVHAGLI